MGAWIEIYYVWKTDDEYNVAPLVGAWIEMPVCYYQMCIRDRNNLVPKRGWCQAKVSYAIDLNPNGKIKEIYPLKTEQTNGKKMCIRDRMMELLRG